jgi:hypothetical protein
MLATKFASNSNAHIIHTLRAKGSQRPGIRTEDAREDAGCKDVPGSDPIAVFLVSLTGDSR